MTYNQLVFQFIKKYPFLILLTIILGFSGAIFNGISTALLIPLLLIFIGQDGELSKGFPPVLEKLISLFDGLPENQKAIGMFLTVFISIFLKNATSFASTVVSGHLSRRLVNGLRIDAIKNLLDVDIDFYSKAKIGNVLNTIGNELTRTAASIRITVSMAINVITITIFFWLLIAISWQLTLVAILALSLVTIANQFFNKRAKYFGRILSRKSGAFTSKIIEILMGIRVIKTAGNEGQEYQLAKKLAEEKEKAEFDSQVNSAILGPFNEMSGIMVVFTLVIAGYYLFSEQFKQFAPTLLTYLAILFRSIPFVSQLNGNRNKLANQSASVERTTHFLRRDNKPFMVPGQAPYKTLTQGIAFEGVYFSYPGHEELVLQGIDLWIPKGKMTALVGASGSGKSTMADLLARFYDPTEGSITLDGKDLREFDLRSLRRAMGIVSQDTFLFNNTVSYNIAYGLEDVAQEEIVGAAKAANAYEFILNLPKGFETEIGERGVRLSGGQRQRMAIARALLRNPDILILDEATSALDTVSEKLVQQAIDHLAQERTSLVIAHRLSTIQKAHQIVVLDGGQIVEVGTHRELLDRAGYYSRLYSMQFAREVQPS